MAEGDVSQPGAVPELKSADFKTGVLTLEPEQLGILHTPEMRMRMLSHEIRQEVRRDVYVARSCCGFKVDMRWAQLLTQIIVLLFAVIFLIAKMWRSQGCEEQQTWIGLFTFIIGLIVPTPLQSLHGGGSGGRRTP